MGRENTVWVKKKIESKKNSLPKQKTLHVEMADPEAFVALTEYSPASRGKT